MVNVSSRRQLNPTELSRTRVHCESLGVQRTYECVNGGGKNPSASNKRSITTNVSQSGSFTADQNGNIVGSLTLTPLTAEQVGFTCPPGQTVTFVSVTYTNVSIADSTSGATFAVRGTFSYTNPDAPTAR